MTGSLQRRLSEFLSNEGAHLRDMADILEQVSEVGHREDALQYGAQWIGA